MEAPRSTRPSSRNYDSSGALAQPVRSAPYDQEPGYYEPGGLWLYGNVRLLNSNLAHVPGAFGHPDQACVQIDDFVREAEEHVLAGHVLVCGIHNDAHRAVSIVPLRWGAPRILVVSGGFRHHFGESLDEEPFRAARLWRRRWDPLADLAVSRRAPGMCPTYARDNPSVDRLIMALVHRRPACNSADDPLALVFTTPG